MPLLIGAASASPPTPTPTVEVSVTGLRNMKGQILVCLTTNPKAFPDCSKDKSSVRMAVKAADAGDFTVHAPATGTYAIAVVHDENSNNKMDTAIFLPKEGFGFSRNPTITVGPPSFKSASFVLTGTVRQSIKMKYML
ncbi:Uncharacterized conserved protein, DUF2141 family [Sphingopyxis sp. YR583]|uniref:DUF2141 domain-containing protein n=1 Tax=Sphingopyxis sp. YR583 TaxID=1881047 RepID=UPI0008A7DBF9|nr:DUF2141 domain-containing protein [Sphingopyxis sp. YR583]SEH17009.1 Uncharacterized conserved protein, DUF2141 family [Sphingopyxis sp. YR583]